MNTCYYKSMKYYSLIILGIYLMAMNLKNIIIILNVNSRT